MPWPPPRGWLGIAISAAFGVIAGAAAIYAWLGFAWGTVVVLALVLVIGSTFIRPRSPKRNPD